MTNAQGAIYGSVLFKPPLIKNAQEFIARWSSEMTPVPEDLENSQKIVSQAVYNSTEFGAWFAWATGNSFLRLPKPYGVKIGSEGIKAKTPIQVLNFPFSWDDFWEAVETVDKAAEDLGKIPKQLDQRIRLL